MLSRFTTAARGITRLQGAVTLPSVRSNARLISTARPALPAIWRQTSRQRSFSHKSIVLDEARKKLFQKLMGLDSEEMAELARISSAAWIKRDDGAFGLSVQSSPGDPRGIMRVEQFCQRSDMGE